MLFTQLEFIFVFLPITVAGYFLVGRLTESPWPRLAWLTIASLSFYAYWDVLFLPVIIASMVCNYLLARLIDWKALKIVRVWIFAVAILANILALAFYKYTNFGIDIANLVRKVPIAHLDIVLPLGISFFTFTQIAYLVDVFRGKVIERSFLKYALFVSYFPHLIAGPILHHAEMMPQFGSAASRRMSSERTAIALTIFAIGYFKKAIIADGFALIANPVFTAAGQSSVTMMDAWGGALAYSLQIYFDFSGYCDMAIALSLLFGIRLPFNFDAPYKAQSIAEFWRRWHITLSRFLRDYLYIALGGNRHGVIIRNINLFVTMLLGGLWHGAGWTFIIWGGLHGLYLIVNHLWSEFFGRLPVLAKASGTIWYSVAALALTQFSVVVAWVFFRAESLDMADGILSGMFGLADARKLATETYVSGSVALAIAAGYLICLIMPNVNAMFADRYVGLITYDNKRPWSITDIRWMPSPQWAIAASLVLVAAITTTWLAGDGSQFLYFQF